ncbi:MAG TPA: hypothetical protein VKB03_01835 [Conexibacter sp.]|nr:hypothetical protein [Conexibacter sp.]
MSATPEGGAAAPGTNPPASDGEGKRLSIGAVIGIAIAVLVIAGVGGYLIGHDKGETSGDSQGYADGVAAGKQQVQANYEPGKPGYQEIYQAGVQAGKAKGEKAGQQQGEAQGKKVGFEQGHKQGVTTGEDQGVKQGAAAVLGGFNTWTEGAYYVITMQAGTSDGVPYTIDTRTQLQSGTNYRVCQSGSTTQLCESPVTASNANADDDNGGAQE